MLGDFNTTLLPVPSQIATTTADPSPASAPPPSQVVVIADEGGRGEDGDSGRERDPFDMEGGGGGGGGERSFGGNRWPRQETLALLKIRSDMDAAFKEASAKGPLWDEVSRKLSEHGYHRSAKKCKEKFENVFKYHKRTKEGRTRKSEGKTYRFFDQLEAFEAAHPQSLASPPSPKLQPAQGPIPAANDHPSSTLNAVTVPSSTIAHPMVNFIIPGYPPGNNPTVTAQQQPLTQPQLVQQQRPQPPPQVTNVMSSAQQANNNITAPTCSAFSLDFLSDSSSSSSTSSDIEIQGSHRRKRKWKDFFERLMREVIQKQEDMQRRFLEVTEKREHERVAREESWRLQEMARINREREILSQERSMSAAKDVAVMALLQKISDQRYPHGQVPQFVIPQHSQLPPPPTPPPPSQPTSLPPQQEAVPAAAVPPPPLAPPKTTTTRTTKAIAQPVLQRQLVPAKSDKNGDQNFIPASSSRWPKVEVEALISLRTNLDSKYQENGPKGPLWEEISSGMRRLGYNRNAKRCKEKWENINKYFKKVKESNKKRPEDSKTCPYFHQLDALYKEKTNKVFDGSASASSHQHFSSDNPMPLLVQPEQQWPPPQHDSNTNTDDIESEQDDDNYKDNEDEIASGYENVANSGGRPSTMSTGN